MRRAKPRSLRLLSTAVVVLALGGSLVGSRTAGAQEPELVPIVFVHGAAGSAAQYETQARRFDGNGYPARYVRAFEYDSSFATNTFAQVIARLDATVDALRTEFGVDRVYLVGHSLGTFVSNTYLGDAGRAAKIAKYVGVDGSSNASCGVTDPNLTAWGSGRGRTPPATWAATTSASGRDARAGGHFRGIVRGAVRVLHRGRAGDDARPAGAARPGRDLGPRGAVPAECRRSRRHDRVRAVDARTGARKAVDRAKRSPSPTTGAGGRSR